MFTTYMVLREDYLSALTNLVRNAEERVLISMYVASTSRPVMDFLNTLAMQVKKGVNARVLLNGVGADAKKYNEAFAEVAERLGVLVRLTDTFIHTKVVVVDDWVLVGSHNLVGPSQRAKDISVAIRSRHLADFVANDVFDALWRGGYWGGYFATYLGEGGMVEFYGGVPILEKLRIMIDYAVSKVSAAYFVATVSRGTRPIYDSLARKKSEGVDVAVVLSGEPASALNHNRKVVSYLRKRRVPAVIYPGKLHAKIAAVDEAVMIGSHNLTSASTAGRAEISVVVWAEGLAEVIHDWVSELFKEAEKEQSGSSGD